MRPLGPVPVIFDKSRCFCPAIAFAAGEAKMRADWELWLGAEAGAFAAGADAASVAAAAGADEDEAAAAAASGAEV